MVHIKKNLYKEDKEEVKKKEKMNKEGEDKRAFYWAWCQVFYPSYLILPILSHFETLVSTDKPWSCWGAWITTKPDYSWPWHWGPDTPCLVQTQAGREAAPMVWWEPWWRAVLFVSSLRPRPCSLIPRAALFQSLSLLTPLLHLPLDKRTQGQQQGQRLPSLPPLPGKVQKERKLSEAWAQDRVGRWQERNPNRAWSILAPLLNFSFSSFAAFQFHSLFQWDLGIALKWW